MNLHKYAVVLHNYEDLDDFYNDMETEGGSITIPNRAVDVDLRKPKSRVTHYMLTPQEALEVVNDTRVEFVEIVDDNPPDRLFTQTGSFSRSSTNRANDNQWGLWRHIAGENNDNFDSSNDTINGTIDYQYTGRNVDVVILDDQAWQPDHTEFLDGNGVTRVVDYNWWQHASAVGDSAHVGRTYAQRGTSGNFHNIHCAGTVAGREEGWAKDANIYFFALDFQGNDLNNSISPGLAFDYIREFHNNKPINPVTGYKNPTIVNNSWGYSRLATSASSIASVTYDGTTHTPGGDITTEYNGYYGAYSTTSQVVARAGDPENSKNRFTTSGSSSSVIDRMVAWPEEWEKIPNQTFSFTQTDPADNYEITILTPCDVRQNSRIVASCNSEDSYMIIKRIVNNGAIIATTVRGPEIDFELTGGFGFSFFGPSGNVTIRYIVETYPADGDEFTFDVAWTVTTGERGQFFSNFNDDLANDEFEEFTEDNPAADPNASGSVVAQPFTAIDSVSGLTADSTPTSGNNDDGWWTLNLPFSIQYLGSTYSTIHVGTNSFVTFGSGSKQYIISPSVPALPKIMIGAKDRRGYSIWHGVEGTAPNREYRIVWEGSEVYYRNTPDSPGMRWELRFFENASNEYEITWEQNSAKNSTGGVFTSTQLASYGYNTSGRHTSQRAAVDADIVDAIADGIIVVASAGNGRVPMYSSDHPYYNNYYTTTGGSNTYYHRPQTPAGAGNGTDSAVICVGALSNVHLNDKEQRVYFSNFGENVDIFAAGHYIQSAMPDASSRTKVDRGGGNYYAKVSGTSMSGPQVCGIIACMLEEYPDMTQKQAREMLRVISKPDQMYDDPQGTYDFDNSLEGAANLVLWMPSSRNVDKPRHPKPHRGRPRSGAVYPRRRIRRRRRV
jgi:hypothetical protein